MTIFIKHITKDKKISIIAYKNKQDFIDKNFNLGINFINYNNKNIQELCFLLNFAYSSQNYRIPRKQAYQEKKENSQYSDYTFIL